MMDYNDISPKYITDLKTQLGEKIWEVYSSYKKVRLFIISSVKEGDYNEPDSFQIYYNGDNQATIDLDTTLLHMPPHETVKMAIDLGIDTPGFLPAIPKFKNILKNNNTSAFENFDRAIKNVYESPDLAVSLAASTLEGIIKTILKDDGFSSIKKNLSLSKLIKELVKELGFDRDECPAEIKIIAGQLRGIVSTVDDLRSNKSTAHGKDHEEYVINDPLWASFIVNTSASLGLFLWEYYDKKYKPALASAVHTEDNSNNPINMDDIPF